VDADGDDTNGVQVGTGGIFSGMNAFNAVNAVNNSTGTIDYAISLLGEPSGVSGSGTLFSITLEGASEGFSALGFVTVMLASRGGSQISATTVNGAVNVGAQQATETPTTGTPTTTETPMTETPTTGTPTPTSTTPAGQATNTPTPTATVPAGQCTHTVQWGDTLYSIARRYGTTVSVLVSMNGIANPNFIYVGQTLSVPCAATPTPVTQTPAPGCSGSYYTVVSGDTLYSIARRYGTTVDAITAVNYIPNPNFIYVGQRICIPTGQPGPTATPSPGCSAHYTVQAGDTLIAIAARFGTTYWAIAMANNISNPNLIYPGTTLCIP
jgi:LysM repeat protein